MVFKKRVLYTFTMGDVEDPYLYAAFPIGDWQETEHGKWVMEHAIEPPEFICVPDPVNYGYRVVISGRLVDEDYTFFMLKWGQCV